MGFNIGGRIERIGRVVDEAREPGLGQNMGEIPGAAAAALQVAAQQRHAENEINDMWTSLGNAPGAAIGDLVKVEGGYFRQYAHGRIYFRLSTDHAFWVYGFIGDRYAELNGPEGWLGWPTSDEMDFPEDGRVRTFEKGTIYWWADTGARDLNEVVVHYTGLHCFGETDVDLLSSADEPYATIGIVGPDGTTGTFRSQIYEDVDAGEGRSEIIELFHGKPNGLVINTILQEHSDGDPEESRKVMKEAVEKGGVALTALVSNIPVVGPVLGPLTGVAIEYFKGDILEAMNYFVENTLGFSDRPLGTNITALTPKQMVILATRPEGQDMFGEIPWRFETGLLSRFGATYKVYFNIYAG